jgi:hypothetical protein
MGKETNRARCYPKYYSRKKAKNVIRAKDFKIIAHSPI